jgi:hypothetical protein
VKNQQHGANPHPNPRYVKWDARRVVTVPGRMEFALKKKKVEMPEPKRLFLPLTISMKLKLYDPGDRVREAC